MRRRLVHPPTVVVAVLSLLIAACNATPAVTPAPALTDPKEIVAKGAASLTDVRTVEFTATFNGNLQATGLGAFDLSTIKLAGSADFPERPRASASTRRRSSARSSTRSSSATRPTTRSRARSRRPSTARPRSTRR